MDFLKEQGILMGESRTSGDGETNSPDFPIVMCSNFIGDALDAASAEGFREVLLVGHIGKLVKVAGGIMNTHSRYADCRMELFAAHAAICGANGDICRRLMHCVSTDACLDILKETGLCDEVMRALLESMEKYLLRRVNGAYEVGAVTFSNVHGVLGVTPGAGKMLERYRLEDV
jgi:cobalt-precorrin-5B (C1)-methyltransferase